MKHFMKRPLKIAAAVAFMVALGYGVSTDSEFSESGKTGNVNLSALSGVSAQSETGGGGNCNYRNGYRAFRSRSGGAYDCCMVWRNNKPRTAQTCLF